MDNNSISRIQQQMQEKATNFPDYINSYMCSKESEESLLNNVTQPHWQSIQLSKRRLNKKGIKIYTNQSYNKYSSNLNANCVATHEESNQYVGSLVKKAITRKHIYKDDKLIYNKKFFEILNIHLFKSKVNGDLAICPNCGHEGKISSYIDGCDYCGAKYKVRDFDTKVSGYSYEEDTTKKARSTYFKGLLTLVLITVGLLIIGIISFSLLIGFLIKGNNGKDAIETLIPSMFAYTYVPAFFKSIRILLFLSIIFGVFVTMFYKKNITGGQKVSSVIPNFSEYDFYQELEYKLKNIHMADSSDEVAPFTEVDLAGYTQVYENVIDCSLTRLHFLNAYIDNGKYYIDVSLKLCLLELKGNRIKKRYERISCTLSGNKELVNNNYTKILEYKCPNCGSSINILNGGVCDYCTTHIDYSKLGWIFTNYTVTGKNSNSYRIIILAMLVTYFFVLSTQIYAATKADRNNDELSFNYVYSLYNNSDKLIKLIYEFAPLPETMDSSLACTYSNHDYTVWTYTYNATFTDYEAYCSYLMSNGFKVTNSSSNNSDVENKTNTISSLDKKHITLRRYLTCKQIKDKAIEIGKYEDTIKSIEEYIKGDGYILAEVTYENGKMNIKLDIDSAE